MAHTIRFGVMGIILQDCNSLSTILIWKMLRKPIFLVQIDFFTKSVVKYCVFISYICRFHCRNSKYVIILYCLRLLCAISAFSRGFKKYMVCAYCITCENPKILSSKTCFTARTLEKELWNTLICF